MQIRKEMKMKPVSHWRKKLELIDSTKLKRWVACIIWWDCVPDPRKEKVRTSVIQEWKDFEAEFVTDFHPPTEMKSSALLRGLRLIGYITPEVRVRGAVSADNTVNRARGTGRVKI